MKFLEAVLKAGEQNYIVDKNGTRVFVKDYVVFTEDDHALGEVSFIDRDDWMVGTPIKQTQDQVDFFRAMEALEKHKIIKSCESNWCYRLTTGGNIEGKDGECDWEHDVDLCNYETSNKWIILD